MAEVIEPVTQELGLGGDLKGRLRDEVACVLEGADLSSTTLGQVRAKLEHKMGLESGGLNPHREYLRELLQEKIQEMQENADEEVQDENGIQTPPRKEENKEKKRRRRIMEATIHLAKKYRRVERLGTNGGAAQSPAEEIQPIEVKIGDATVNVPFKKFNDGRQGFHCMQQVVVERGGRKMQMQCMISCAVMENEDFAETLAEVPETEAQEVLEKTSEALQTEVLELVTEDAPQPEENEVEKEAPQTQTGEQEVPQPMEQEVLETHAVGQEIPQTTEKDIYEVQPTEQEQIVEAEATEEASKMEG
jgi:hypothetical protein|eukprot:CAMPEP_0169117656 /NCGR_PEP_ID=MMETSP1015-20121227/30581_1 /TAXON_ID=342587 /ORGANISM="Karlodinium micrum, Strain CCMP2283" /LENGTH=304 /DNA_ID=CAMNT_0009180367 /DNA_START=53 /DNA_END=967 /DNA_ORIENTATION=-